LFFSISSSNINKQDHKIHKLKYELQDIMKLYVDSYLEDNEVTSIQLKTIKDISNCRSSALVVVTIKNQEDFLYYLYLTPLQHGYISSLF
jgi:hypothetical protein